MFGQFLSKSGPSNENVNSLIPCHSNEGKEGAPFEILESDNFLNNDKSERTLQMEAKV